MKNLKDLVKIRAEIRKKEPLIQAITNPIAINMVANSILFVGAKPICAEHPQEMEDITPKADALSINLGNINQQRMEAMDRASFFASKKGLPIVIDLVGIGASKLRLDFAKNLLDKYKFSLLKGNASEIIALAKGASSAKGVDVGKDDEDKSLEYLIKTCQDLSKKYQAAVLLTGKTDILVKDNKYYLIENGCPELSNITATGCMLTGLISAFIAVTDVINASLLAMLIMEIGAEMSDKVKPYSFFVDLMDKIGTISDETIINHAKIKEGEI